jgi:hypothetical protein
MKVHNDTWCNRYNAVVMPDEEGNCSLCGALLWEMPAVKLSVTPIFPLGQLLATPGAFRNAKGSNIDLVSLLERHAKGDWGDLDEADKQENELSVQKGFRILSAYGKGDNKLWVITEADRSVTTILRPDEY